MEPEISQHPKLLSLAERHEMLLLALVSLINLCTWWLSPKTPPLTHCLASAKPRLVEHGVTQSSLHCGPRLWITEWSFRTQCFNMATWVGGGFATTLAVWECCLTPSFQATYHPKLCEVSALFMTLTFLKHRYCVLHFSVTLLSWYCPNTFHKQVIFLPSLRLSLYCSVKTHAHVNGTSPSETWTLRL